MQGPARASRPVPPASGHSTCGLGLHCMHSAHGSRAPPSLLRFDKAPHQQPCLQAGVPATGSCSDQPTHNFPHMAASSTQCYPSF